MIINSFIYFSYFSYFLAYREVMSNGQGSSPQAEAIQKKMDALMTRYLTMKAALLVQSAIDNSMLLCAASGSWMVQLALSLDQVDMFSKWFSGISELDSQILADQLTLSQPWGADYAHHSATY